MPDSTAPAGSIDVVVSRQGRPTSPEARPDRDPGVIAWVVASTPHTDDSARRPGKVLGPWIFHGARTGEPDHRGQRRGPTSEAEASKANVRSAENARRLREFGEVRESVVASDLSARPPRREDLRRTFNRRGDVTRYAPQ